LLDSDAIKKLDIASTFATGAAGRISAGYRMPFSFRPFRKSSPCDYRNPGFPVTVGAVSENRSESRE